MPKKTPMKKRNCEPADDLLEGIRKSISSVKPEVQSKFIDMIAEAKTVFIYGAGRSGLIGQLFAVRLVQIGLNVHFIGDMTTPIISSEDVAILISNTGETMSVVQTANIARRLGCNVISVTSNESNKLAHASNHIVVLEQEKKIDSAPLGTMFEDSVSIFFDSIIPRLMEKLNVTEDDMRKRHAIWV